jgi:hypothetical protein
VVCQAGFAGLTGAQLARDVAGAQIGDQHLGTKPVSKETYYRGKRDLLYADFVRLAINTSWMLPPPGRYRPGASCSWQREHILSCQCKENTFSLVSRPGASCSWQREHILSCQCIAAGKANTFSLVSALQLEKRTHSLLSVHCSWQSEHILSCQCSYEESPWS